MKTLSALLLGLFALSPLASAEVDARMFRFPDVSELLSVEGIRTSAELAQELLTTAHVAVTPGEAFDAPGFLRISYATSLERLREGTNRILEFVKTSDRLTHRDTPAVP